MMKDRNAYIYVYLDPVKPGRYRYGKYSFDYEPYYVGKGSMSANHNRLYDHIHEAEKNKGTNKHKINKIRRLLKCYSRIELMKYVIVYIDGLNESDAYKKEKELIEIIGCRYMEKGPLLNLSEGGRGGYAVFDEVRINLKNVSKVYMQTMEYRNALKEGKKRSNYISHRKGVRMVDEYTEEHLMEYRIKHNTARSVVLFMPDATMVICWKGTYTKICNDYNLDIGSMRDVALGKKNNYRGWDMYYLDEGLMLDELIEKHNKKFIEGKLRVSRYATNIKY